MTQPEKSYTVVVVGRSGAGTFTDVWAKSEREAAAQTVANLRWPDVQAPMFAIVAPAEHCFDIAPTADPQWKVAEDV